MLTPNEKQISELLNLGNNPKQIAQQRKTSIQAVYKTIKRLKKKGLVIGSSYTGFKIQTTLTHTYKAIRLHGQEFNIKIRTPSQKYLNHEKSFILDNNRIRLFDKSLEVYLTQNFLGETAEQCLFKSVAYFKRLSFLIQEELNIRFNNVKLVNAHYSELDNELAKDYNDNKKKLCIRDLRDGKVWAKIDFSLHINEFETLHPETAQKDMDNLLTYFNDFRDNNPLNNSQLTSRLNDTITAIEKIKEVLDLIVKRIQ